MERPTLELADIFRTHGAVYRQTHALPRAQLRLMRAIELCRTAALGGHVRKCGHCSHQQIAYNSCRNRHCPKCQGRERAQWVAQRTADLLPVEYFHVVFTIPEHLAPLALQNKRVVYGILLRAAAETLLTIARDPKHLGAEIGFFAVLHTWGQKLLHHPHVHCVVPGGGIAVGENRWVSCLPGFFLPVRVLSRLFRRLFVEALQSAFAKGDLEFHGELRTWAEACCFQTLLDRARQNEWVVYAKPPFGGPRQALEYLGRYSHRVAISNERLLAQTESTVTFGWKDYRQPHRKKTMTLAGEEFVRRFLLHTLPDKFPRIRHYGWLSNRSRKQKLALCRSLLDNSITALLPRLTEEFRGWSEALLAEKDWRCPRCGTGVLEIIEVLAPQRYVPQGIDSS